jgi:hypothetical protein
VLVVNKPCRTFNWCAPCDKHLLTKYFIIVNMAAEAIEHALYALGKELTCSIW